MRARSPRSPVRVAGLLFAAAAILRWLTAERITAIFNDGPHFIFVAKQMAEGRWEEAFAHPYHPLYPLAIRAAHTAISDWETAAVFVSVLGGSVGVVALYLFLRSAFDERIAWLGGGLLAIHPYAIVFTADVQSEGLYLATFLAGLASLWWGFAERRVGPAFAAGLCTGLAYLTRPEGIGLAIVGAAAMAVSAARDGGSLRRPALWTAALLVGVTILVAPYVVMLHSTSGDWQLSRKKSVGSLMAIEEYSPARLEGVPGGAAPAARSRAELEAAAAELGPIPPSPPLDADRGHFGAGAEGQSASVAPAARIASTFREVAVTFLSGFRAELLILLAVGLWQCRGRPGNRGLLIGGIVALYVLVLFGLAFNVGYLSRRHVLPPLLPLLGYTAVGVQRFGGWIVAFAARAIPSLSPRRSGAAAAVGLVLVAGVSLPKALRLHRAERLAEREAAEWLAEHAELRGPVAAEGARLAYYAGEPLVPIRRSQARDEFALLRDRGARFVVVDEAYFDHFQGLRGALGEQLYLIHRVEANGRSAVVLEVGPVDAPRAPAKGTGSASDAAGSAR